MMSSVAGLSRSGLAERREGVVRLAAAGFAVALLAVLVVASRLAPSASGSGTHRQLGLPPCGWVQSFNRPCPTCGMTTAFAHAAHGRLDSAFVAQPMGAVLSIVTAAGFWASIHVLLTGSRVGEVCGRLLRPRVLWVALGAAGAAWAYKLVTWPT